MGTGHSKQAARDRFTAVFLSPVAGEAHFLEPLYFFGQSRDGKFPVGRFLSPDLFALEFSNNSPTHIGNRILFSLLTGTKDKTSGLVMGVFCLWFLGVYYLLVAGSNRRGANSNLATFNFLWYRGKEKNNLGFCFGHVYPGGIFTDCNLHFWAGILLRMVSPKREIIHCLCGVGHGNKRHPTGAIV